MQKYFIIIFINFILILLISCSKNKDKITAPNTSDPDSTATVYKPNIYIYPTHSIELDVYLAFPMGGTVVYSIPRYENGWSVIVDTSGLIDNEYQYLFYECQVPNLFQKENGWIVNQENLEVFFRTNLTQTGFIEPEIEDFIEFWIPLLNYSSEFILYPQYSNDIFPLIDLSFSEQPDCLLRYFYLIEENTNGITNVEEPIIPEFKRSGFVVAEWGVIII